LRAVIDTNRQAAENRRRELFALEESLLGDKAKLEVANSQITADYVD
jgi:hypothetical protein